MGHLSPLCVLGPRDDESRPASTTNNQRHPFEQRMAPLPFGISLPQRGSLLRFVTPVCFFSGAAATLRKLTIQNSLLFAWCSAVKRSQSADRGARACACVCAQACKRWAWKARRPAAPNCQRAHRLMYHPLLLWVEALRACFLPRGRRGALGSVGSKTEVLVPCFLLDRILATR